MNPGPAPTLLSEWVTADAFWAFIAFAAFAVVVWMAAQFLKRMRTQDDEQPAPKPAPQPTQCQITGCTSPGTHLFDAIPSRLFYACTGHTPKVRDWAGPYDRTIETVYDQDLDQADDLGQWNKEMDAS